MAPDDSIAWEGGRYRDHEGDTNSCLRRPAALVYEAAPRPEAAVGKALIRIHAAGASW